jgi:hypothetical protein
MMLRLALAAFLVSASLSPALVVAEDANPPAATETTPAPPPGTIAAPACPCGGTMGGACCGQTAAAETPPAADAKPAGTCPCQHRKPLAGKN